MNLIVWLPWYSGQVRNLSWWSLSKFLPSAVPDLVIAFKEPFIHESRENRKVECLLYPDLRRKFTPEESRSRQIKEKGTSV